MIWAEKHPKHNKRITVKWRLKNPDKVEKQRIKYKPKANASQRKYCKAHPEKVYAACMQWRKNNPEKFKKIQERFYVKKQDTTYYADSHRKSSYGIGQEQFNEIRKSQKNRCKICNLKFVKTPHIDHSHKTGKIRGLLCRLCNSVLGYVKEDRKILQAAIEYLDYFQIKEGAMAVKKAVVEKAAKKMVVKKAVKKGQAKAQAAAPVKETKESMLLKLLLGKELCTAKEIIKKTGFSQASLNMYLSQAYLDRKNKPYKIVAGTKGKEPAFRYVAKGKVKGK